MPYFGSVNQILPSGCTAISFGEFNRFPSNLSVTVVADKFEGKRLNSPNDIAVHPDGSIWFTDPKYGINGNYEGFKADSELHVAVYRVDGKTLKIEKITDEFDGPNGICFSPDY